MLPVGHWYRYRELDGDGEPLEAGYLTQEEARKHQADCSLFPVEYRRIQLVPCEVDWWRYCPVEHVVEDGYFARFRGVLFLVSSSEKLAAHCGRCGDSYSVYPHRYRIVPRGGVAAGRG